VALAMHFQAVFCQPCLKLCLENVIQALHSQPRACEKDQIGLMHNDAHWQSDRRGR
jgi:hypothetical protein